VARRGSYARLLGPLPEDTMILRKPPEDTVGLRR
jgi:ATP-binding cassette, subfamily B, bacterial